MYSNIDFQNYLSSSKDTVDFLDLSKASILEIIEELIKMKSKISPIYSKSYSSLIYHLKALEKQFNCTLMPHQITDIFWHNFIPFLLKQGLSLSSIKKACSQLRTVLNWGARYNAKVSPTYDVIKIPSYCRQQIALTPDEVSHIYHFDLSTIDRRPHLSNESAVCIRWPKYWSFSFSISPSNEYSGFISFRIDWFDFLAVQGTLKSLFQ